MSVLEKRRFEKRRKRSKTRVDTPEGNFFSGKGSEVEGDNSQTQRRGIKSRYHETHKVNEKSVEYSRVNPGVIKKGMEQAEPS